MGAEGRQNFLIGRLYKARRNSELSIIFCGSQPSDLRNHADLRQNSDGQKIRVQCRGKRHSAEAQAASSGEGGHS